MKKLLLILAATLALSVVASAQPRALGARLGWGGELSYQHTLGAQNFLEADFGWTIGSFSAALAYDFLIAPVGPLNFYAGPQVTGILVNEGGVGVGAGAQLGLEWCCQTIPLQLSLDWRPTLYFVPATVFGWQGICLGIRYLF